MKPQTVLAATLGLCLASDTSFLYTRADVDELIDLLEAREAELDGWLDARGDDLSAPYGPMRRDAGALFDDVDDEAFFLDVVRRASKPAPTKKKAPAKASKKADPAPDMNPPGGLYDPATDPTAQARQFNAQQ